MYQLEIEFWGLCMFVPDHGRQMHVLMPPTQPPSPDDQVSGSRHHTEPHEAHLFYYAAADDPEAPDGVVEVDVRLEGKALDLSHLRGPINTALWKEIPNLYPCVGERIPRSRVGPSPRGRVTSRVTLAAGRISAVRVGPLWIWVSPPPQHGAFQVVWTLPLEELPQEWELRYLDSGRTEQLPPPLAFDNVVPMYVWHVPLRYLTSPMPPPEQLHCYDPAEHFEAFYSLYDEPVHRPVPMFWDDDRIRNLGRREGRAAAADGVRAASESSEASVAPVPETRATIPPARISDPYNCVGCGGELAGET